MSDTLTPDEVSRIYLIECHTCDEHLHTNNLPVAAVAAWAGKHHHELEVHFQDDMGLIPNEVA